MNLGGHKVEESPIRVRWEPVRISLTALVVGWLARRLARLVLAVVTSPTALAGLTAVVVLALVWRHLGSAFVLSAALVLATGLVAFRWRRPVLFEWWVGLRLRSGWRQFWVYRRLWQASVDTAGLNVHRGGAEHLPVLVRVTSTRAVDRVRVRMLPGQTLEDWAKVADRLCQTFGAQDCRVRTVPERPHLLELWFLTRDPLTQPVQPLPSGEVSLAGLAGLAGLAVGLREDGEVYRLRLLGTHVLVVGATGAGKGSVLWSVITQLAPAVRVGLVRVWALDPKGGMELAAGRPLFDRFVHGSTDTGKGFEQEFALVLEDAVEVMRRRQDSLRGVTRLHEPSVAEPFLVLVVDELAALTAYVSDRELKRRIGNALGLLLSQGRAVGVTVVAAVQDPRKETIPARDLSPTRIALRLNEAEQVHLVLGPGARDRGARCDLIPDTQPGIGYVTVDGIAEPVRVRFSHLTDDHITDLVQPPALQPPALQPAAVQLEPTNDELLALPASPSWSPGEAA
ncbi:FtsK/SpoIIIE domain-containing protein [uncultured Friedmanniella sp.]|uniref:FtsK/SpoIIIE domain-containing protein n=1 Tax=uncultured Friedmanniella sp. TaxID=335381 RepID=UPI0035CA60C2